MKDHLNKYGVVSQVKVMAGEFDLLELERWSSWNVLSPPISVILEHNPFIIRVANF